MERQTEIFALERDFWLRGGGDPEFWRRHCSDDALIVLAMGSMGKSETIAAMEDAPGWSAVEFDDVHWVHAAESSIVAYRAAARSKGSGVVDYRAMISSGYRKDGDGWKLIFHQQTPLE